MASWIFCTVQYRVSIALGVHVAPQCEALNISEKLAELRSSEQHASHGSRWNRCACLDAIVEQWALMPARTGRQRQQWQPAKRTRWPRWARTRRSSRAGWWWIRRCTTSQSGCQTYARTHRTVPHLLTWLDFTACSPFALLFPVHCSLFSPHF